LAAPGYRFSEHPGYVAAFRQSIAMAAALPCDILLTPHPGASGFWDKIARRQSPDDVTPLVDAGACRAYAADAGKVLDAQLVRERTTTK
jgi:metallo-beta-lactamase class B